MLIILPLIIIIECLEEKRCNIGINDCGTLFVYSWIAYDAINKLSLFSISRQCYKRKLTFLIRYIISLTMHNTSNRGDESNDLYICFLYTLYYILFPNHKNENSLYTDP